MPPKTILLVDDDSQHLMLHSLVLKKAGFRPIATLVGSLSLGMHEHENPALIFLDYRLNTALSARQVAILLRERFPQARLIVMSSFDALPEEMKGVADGFVHKGEPADLVAIARELLPDEKTG